MSDTEILKLNNKCGIPLSGIIEDDFPITRSQKIEKWKEDYNGIINGMREMTQHFGEGTYAIASEGTYVVASVGVRYIDEIINPVIVGIFQDIGFVKDVMNTQMELLRNKVYTITKDAENLLSSDNILMDITSKVIIDIEGLLKNLNKNYELNIFLSTDKEVPDWEEFVISILVDEQDFNKIIELWDMIEEEAEKRISETKQVRRSEISHIENIDKNLVIRVDSLEHV